MSKHSPGPWRVEEGDTCNGAETFAIIGNGWVLAKVYNETEKSKANALLMAAGPEMLAALEAVFQARAPQFNFDFGNAPDMEMLYQAIKKAKGKS